MRRTDDGTRRARLRTGVTAGLTAAMLTTTALAAAGPASAATAVRASTVPVGAASLPATPSTAAAFAAPRTTAAPTKAATAAAPRARILRPGDRGPAVLAVQKRLTALGYWLGAPDGRYGALTEQAVFAVQKAAGLRRDGRVGPATRRALARGVRPAARTRKGDAVEVDLRRQLLLVVRGGRVVTVLNTSTGTGRRYTSPSGRRLVASTPRGTFRVSWSYNGWRDAELGRLYRPRYFHPRGIAVHGATSVPPRPASHGCVRVSVAAMDLVWRKGWMRVGSTVVVR